MSTTVIVGGVAAGMSAATRLRRLDESAEIIVLERGSDVSFANCGLPYHLGGVIEQRDALVLQTPNALAARFRLDVRVDTEVLAIDRAAREVAVRGPEGESRIRYDHLVLATGAAPVRPGIPGDELALPLRDLADLDILTAAVDAGVARAVVLGAGYIGLEVVENLVHRGVAVTLVQRGEQVLTALDPEMTAPVAARLVENGVEVRLGVEPTAIDPDGVDLSDGSRVDAQLVIAALGVRPESDLAVAAGLPIGPSGAVVVDDQQRTADPAIFAVGDVAEKSDPVLDRERPLALAGPANRHGRLVADVIAGREVHAAPSRGVAIVSVFGLAAAIVGASEKALREAGRTHRVIHSHPTHHAAYYPGARQIALKLLVDPATDAILGAQAVGVEGADRRIDVIATAMAGGITASGLADLELAYAPQFGSAKDPVNMLGFIAENQRDGLDRTVQWHELEQRLAAGATLLDVRATGQLAEGAIPGSIWVPVEELRERVGEIPAGELIVHCRVGQGAHTGLRLLRELGREAANLDGGFLTWRDGMAARALVAEPANA